MTPSTKLLEPTLADAFDVGRKEGLKEAFSEIKALLPNSGESHLKTYIEARLKSILDFENNNPFRTKESK
jgi:hypothetical protein